MFNEVAPISTEASVMLEPLSRLHFITFDHPAISHAHLAEEACRGGVQLVQLRTKGKEFAEWRSIAQEVKSVCDRYCAKLIVNDNIAVAQAVKADGVHLGKNDMPVNEARRTVDPDFIIGGTANTVADLEKLVEMGVDYVGIGPFRFTASKDSLSPLLGLTGFAELSNAADSLCPEIPLIGIGGITIADVPSILGTGVYGVAVSAAIGKATSIYDAASQFNLELKKGLK